MEVLARRGRYGLPRGIEVDLRGSHRGEIRGELLHGVSRRGHVSRDGGNDIHFLSRGKRRSLRAKGKVRRASHAQARQDGRIAHHHSAGLLLGFGGCRVLDHPAKEIGVGFRRAKKKILYHAPPARGELDDDPLVVVGVPCVICAEPAGLGADAEAEFASDASHLAEASGVGEIHEDADAVFRVAGEEVVHADALATELDEGVVPRFDDADANALTDDAEHARRAPARHVVLPDERVERFAKLVDAEHPAHERGEVLSEVLSEETRDELLIDLPVFDDEDERLGDVDLRRHVAAPVEEVTERLERRGHLRPLEATEGVRRALRRGAVIIAAENIAQRLCVIGELTPTIVDDGDEHFGQLSSEKRGDSVPQGGVENLREEDAERPESGEVALDARDVSHGFAQAEVDFHFDILCGNGVIVALSRRDEEGGGKAGTPRHSKKGGASRNPAPRSPEASGREERRRSARRKS